MAELFRAKMTGDEGFEKLIAVKKILPHLVGEKKLVESFIDEARLAAFLQHGNIIRTYDFGKMENDYFIAMDYLFGKNLKNIMDASKQKALHAGYENILYIISSICNGLDYAHSLKDFQGRPLNIIHRDISPPNIFITYDGEVKIIDFGVAKAASQNTTTRIGVIKGKVAYMSPEQADGKNIDYRSDIFAIGAIFYELVTGRQLYSGDTMQVLSKARNGEFEPPENLATDLPPGLCEIIHYSLAKNPNDRYQSCREMLNEVDKCICELSFRPTTWILARYMKKLFDKEFDQEEIALREVAGAECAEDQILSGMHPDIDEAYDKTMLIGDEKLQELIIKKKICVVGALATGKTSISRRFSENIFTEKYHFTMGATIRNKLLNFEGQKVSIDIWDMGGNDQSAKIQPNFFRDTGGYFLVIDCTRLSTLKAAALIQKKVETATNKAPFICLLNKIDLSKESKITNSSIRELEKKGWVVLKTSAKTGLGISKAFMALVDAML